MSLHFNVSVVGEEPVSGILEMDWRSGGPHWTYTLGVNNIEIPARWTKSDGAFRVEPPEVVGPGAQSLAVLAASQAVPPPDAFELMEQGAENIGLSDMAEAPAMFHFPQSSPSLATPTPARALQPISTSRAGISSIEANSTVTCCGSPCGQSVSDTRQMVNPPPAYHDSGTMALMDGSRQIVDAPPAFDSRMMVTPPPMPAHFQTPDQSRPMLVPAPR